MHTQLVDRKMGGRVVDILLTSAIKTFTISRRLLVETNPPQDPASLIPSSDNSTFEETATTSPILVAHAMVSSLMGTFDFMEKKDIPPPLLSVLSNAQFLEVRMCSFVPNSASFLTRFARRCCRPSWP